MPKFFWWESLSTPTNFPYISVMWWEVAHAFLCLKLAPSSSLPELLSHLIHVRQSPNCFFITWCIYLINTVNHKLLEEKDIKNYLLVDQLRYSGLLNFPSQYLNTIDLRRDFPTSKYSGQFYLLSLHCPHQVNNLSCGSPTPEGVVILVLEVQVMRTIIRWDQFSWGLEF